MRNEQAFIEISGPPGQLRIQGSGDYVGGHQLAESWRDRPQGLWGEWHWDGRRLVVRNDPLGFHPLFYHGDGSRLIVSPSLLTVAARAGVTRIDPVSFGVFLCLGFFVGEDTALEGIRCLPPAATLTFDGTLELEGGPWAGAPVETDREGAARSFVEIVRQAVAHRHPGDRKWAMPLSGGRDSRYLLHSLLRAGADRNAA